MFLHFNINLRFAIFSIICTGMSVGLFVFSLSFVWLLSICLCILRLPSVYLISLLHVGIEFAFYYLLRCSIWYTNIYLIWSWFQFFNIILPPELSSMCEGVFRGMGQFGPVWSFAYKWGDGESWRLWARSSVDQTHVFW